MARDLITGECTDIIEKKNPLDDFWNKNGRKKPYNTPEEKRIYELEQELKQLKRGLGASEEDWLNMAGAELNEYKFRQFKANLVAHKKLCQLIAGRLGSVPENGLTAEECREIASMIEPEYWLYIGEGVTRRLTKDIQKRIGFDG